MNNFDNFDNTYISSPSRTTFNRAYEGDADDVLTRAKIRLLESRKVPSHAALIVSQRDDYHAYLLLDALVTVVRLGRDELDDLDPNP